MAIFLPGRRQATPKSNLQLFVASAFGSMAGETVGALQGWSFLSGCVPPFTRGVLGHEIGLALGQAVRALGQDYP